LVLKGRTRRREISERVPHANGEWSGDEMADKIKKISAAEYADALYRRNPESSPEMIALAKLALKRRETREQEPIEQWARRLAEDLAKFND